MLTSEGIDLLGVRLLRMHILSMLGIGKNKFGQIPLRCNDSTRLPYAEHRWIHQRNAEDTYQVSFESEPFFVVVFSRDFSKLAIPRFFHSSLSIRPLLNISLLNIHFRGGSRTSPSDNQDNSCSSPCMGWRCLNFSGDKPYTPSSSLCILLNMGELFRHDKSVWHSKTEP
jgi:hypothetical protein